MKSMKKWLSLLLAVAMIFSIVIIPTAATVTDVTIGLTSTGWYEDDDFHAQCYPLEVTLTGGENFSMNKGEIYVSFDKDVLAFQSEEIGEIAQYVNGKKKSDMQLTATESELANTQGYVTLAFADTSSNNHVITNGQTVAVLYFLVKDNTVETCNTQITLAVPSGKKNIVGYYDTKTVNYTVTDTATLSVAVSGVNPTLSTVTLGTTKNVEVNGTAGGSTTVKAASAKGTDITSSVTWSVSPADKGVTVSADGTVTVGAKAVAGEYTFTATPDGTNVLGSAVTCADKLTVTRATAQAETVTVTGAATITVPGYNFTDTTEGTVTETYTATVTDQYGDTMASPEVTWAVEGYAEASGVSIAAGVLTVTSAAAGGTATVKATCGGKTGSYDVTVSKATTKAAKVTVSGGKTEFTVPTGEAVDESTFAVAMKDQFNADYSGTVAWKVEPSDKGVSVGTDGKVTVAASAKEYVTDTAGQTFTVTATCGEVSDSKEFTVKRAAAVATTAKLYKGETAVEETDTLVIPVSGSTETTYTIKVFDQYGTEMNAGTVSWVFDAVDTYVSHYTGNVTVEAGATKDKTYTLTGTAQGKAATITITVKDIEITWPTVTTKSDATYGDTWGDIVTIPAAGTTGAGSASLNGQAVAGTFTVVYSTDYPNAGVKTYRLNFKSTDGVYNIYSAEYTLENAVAKKELVASVGSVDSKTYDSSTNATGGTITLTGAVRGETPTAVGSFTWTSANAGTDTVSVTNITIDDDWGDNYKLKENSIASAKVNAVISKASLVPSVSSVDSKQYDATTDATNGVIALEGAVPGQNPTATGKFVYTSAAVGTDTFNVSDIELTGTWGTNYELTVTTLENVQYTSGAITKASAATLSIDEQTLLSSTVVSSSKDYTVDLSALTGFALETGDRTYEVDSQGLYVGAQISGSTMTATVATAQTAGTTDAVVVTVKSANYEDSTLTVNFKFYDKVGVSDKLSLSAVTATYGKDYTVAGSYSGTTDDTSKWTYSYTGIDGTTYETSTTKPTAAGKYTITATYDDSVAEGEIPGHTGTVTANLTINPKTLTSAMVAVSGIYTYDKTAKQATVTVTDGGVALSVETDYTVSYDNNVNAGTTAKATVTGCGNYTGTITKNFPIGQKVAELSWTGADTRTYNGTASAVAATVSNLEIDDSCDVTVTGGTETNAGTYTATATQLSNSNYKLPATATKQYIISKDTITGMMLSLGSAGTQDWTGSEIKPELKIYYNPLTASDYTLSYENNINAGVNTAKVTATATESGNFTGTLTYNFTINQRTITDSMVTVTGSYTYNGEEQQATVVVTDTPAMAAGTDYTVAYNNNKNAGTATVTVTGKGNYKGEVTKQFTINPKTLTDAMVAVSGIYTYDKTAKQATVTVTDGAALSVGTDYTVVCKDNVDAGTAKAEVTGCGNYTGTITKNFTIGQKVAELSWTGTDTRTYNGTASAVAATVSNLEIDDSCDVTVTGGTETNAGTYTATATQLSNSNYKLPATATKQYIISKDTITGMMLSLGSAATQDWTGSEIKPELKNYYNLLTASDYTLSYENNINVGENTAKVTATATESGNFTGSITYNFTINAVAPVFKADATTATASAKTVTVAWDYTNGGLDTTHMKSVKITQVDREADVEGYKYTVAMTDGETPEPKFTKTYEYNETEEVLTGTKLTIDELTNNVWYEVVLTVENEKGTDEVTLYAQPTQQFFPSSFTVKTDKEEEKEETEPVVFADAPETEWFYEPVQYVVEKGLMKGTGNGEFSPQVTTTRAMILTILARMENKDDETAANWYDGGVAFGKESGISDGSRVNSTITREEMVTMLYRYAVYKGYVTDGVKAADLSTYGDAESVSDWAKNAMNWAVSIGLLNGIDGNIAPGGSTTRAQSAAFLERFCKMFG